jgi:hypothetical protein
VPQGFPDPNKCIFCGKITYEKTGEHVWPLWFTRTWKIKRGNRPYEAMLRNTGPAMRPLNRKYSSGVVNMEVKPVCRRCNNVRLSSLEGRVKDKILKLWHGESVVLSSQNQIEIAAWVTRIAMLWDFAHFQTQGLYFSPDERKLFVDTLEPPEDSFVWLCVLRPDTMRAGITVIQRAHTEAHEAWIVATGVLGCFAFQFLSRRWNKNLSHAEIDEMMRPIIGGWNAVAEPIWPVPSRELRWPTKSADLTMETFYSFAERWGGKASNFDE